MHDIINFFFIFYSNFTKIFIVISLRVQLFETITIVFNTILNSFENF